MEIHPIIWLLLTVSKWTTKKGSQNKTTLLVLHKVRRVEKEQRLEFPEISKKELYTLGIINSNKMKSISKWPHHQNTNRQDTKNNGFFPL